MVMGPCGGGWVGVQNSGEKVLILCGWASFYSISFPFSEEKEGPEKIDEMEEIQVKKQKINFTLKRHDIKIDLFIKLVHKLYGYWKRKIKRVLVYCPLLICFFIMYFSLL